MKATAQINKPAPIVPPPVFERVTIEMSPREAFLLMAIMGNLIPNRIRAEVNNSSTIDSVCYPASISKPMEAGDLDFTSKIYHELRDLLEKAKREGVK